MNEQYEVEEFVSGVESAEFGNGHIGVVSQIHPGERAYNVRVTDFSYGATNANLPAGKPVMILPHPPFPNELPNMKNYKL